MEFVEVLEATRVWAAAHLAITAGGAVAVAVLTFLCVSAALRRRERGPAALDPAKLAATDPAAAVTGERALNWEPHEPSYADRRRTVRRVGPPVRVTLNDPTFRTGLCDGYVLDRSTGGLKIASPLAAVAGAALRVRAVDAPDTVGFVTVIVRTCRPVAGHYELGCEFDDPPPWNVLLLFG